MNVEIIKTLKLSKNGVDYYLNLGDIITIETKKGTFDLVQITAISEKSISVGSYTNPNANPCYIKFKDIENIVDIYNEKDEEVIVENPDKYEALNIDTWGQCENEEQE